MGQSPSNSRYTSPTELDFGNTPISKPHLLVPKDQTLSGSREMQYKGGELRRVRSARLPGTHLASGDTKSQSGLKIDTNPFRNGRSAEKLSSASKKGSGDSFLSPSSAESQSSYGSHRRSRSANAVVAPATRTSHIIPPPPPYSPKDEQSSRQASFRPVRLAEVHVTSHTGLTTPVSTNDAGPDRPLVRRNSVENALQTLRKYNTVFIVDDSSSMAGRLWQEAKDALASLADVAQMYDTDGIDVCFLNSPVKGRSLRGAASVKRLFDMAMPWGATPIGERLEELLLDYLDKLERAKDNYDAGDRTAMDGIKPTNYIIITDGAPTDDPEEVIVNAARRLDARHFPLSQVGIQFVQIGNFRSATAFLNELDDSLSKTHGIRDMVDTTPYAGQLTVEKLTKILLGGINRRVDRKGGLSVLE